MISPPARNFLNSTFVNLASLRAIEREPLLEIHAADAAPRGITTGQVVRVFNDRGSYRCKAEVTDRARRASWSAWASGGARWDWTAPT
jgi:anaerobic selenocysteine-containing dehydrogenase